MKTHELTKIHFSPRTKRGEVLEWLNKYYPIKDYARMAAFDKDHYVAVVCPARFERFFSAK